MKIEKKIGQCQRSKLQVNTDPLTESGQYVPIVITTDPMCLLFSRHFHLREKKKRDMVP